MSCVAIHPLTNNPTEAWHELSKSQNATELKIKQPTNQTKEGYVRIVCMSDTHSETHNIKFQIPDGDIFIHAGDFTRIGFREEVVKFNAWLKTLSHKHKIVIAGNHDETFDTRLDEATRCWTAKGITKEYKALLDSCIYLEDSSVTLLGIKFYGSPWTPKRFSTEGGFNQNRGEQSLTKWNQIPEDTDVLITHTPPVGCGDLTGSRIRAGCVELYSTVVQRVKPKYHIFGHIHEGYGMYTNGEIIFVNASTCTQYYLPKNPAIVIDYCISADGELKNNASTRSNSCLSQ